MKTYLARSFATILLCASMTSQGDEVVISSGTWTEKGYKIKGNWTILERDSHTVLVFDDEFKTRSGPDLKLYLSTRSIVNLDDKNVEPTSMKIAPLKSHKGAQEYELPGDVDLDEFSSPVIHCEAYSHLWGGANIEKKTIQD